MSLPGPRAVVAAVRVAAIPVLAFLALATWALSSPVGSSPDEDYHLDSIWCGQGIEQGICESAPLPNERRVPESLPNAASCYAFHPEVSAQCQSRWFAPEVHTLAATDRGNFDGTYPPVFYFTMHLLVGQDISKSVVLMRLFNAALFVGLMTATYWLVPRRRRLMLVFGAGATLVPLGVFLIPSVNGSSWAITSAAVAFPALMGFFESTGRRRWALGAIALVAAVMGGGARVDAAVYTVIAAALATFLTFRWQRNSWRLLALPAAMCTVSAFFYVSAGQSGITSAGLAGSSQSGSLRYLIFNNLLNVPSLWAGVTGSWGLGWLDTAMPGVVPVLDLATLGGLAYLGLRQASPRKMTALVVTVIAAWAIPTLILVESRALVGEQVQPRYLLPLIMMLVQVALFRVEPRVPQSGRAPLLTAGGALALTNAVALWTNFRRYLTGVDGKSFNLDTGREWWWAIPVHPMSVWVVGSVAFAVALLLCGFAVARDDADTDTATNPQEVVFNARTTPLTASAPRAAA